jgi:hypothetical protein
MIMLELTAYGSADAEGLCRQLARFEPARRLPFITSGRTKWLHRRFWQCCITCADREDFEIMRARIVVMVGVFGPGIRVRGRSL